MGPFWIVAVLLVDDFDVPSEDLIGGETMRSWDCETWDGTYARMSELTQIPRKYPQHSHRKHARPGLQPYNMVSASAAARQSSFAPFPSEQNVINSLGPCCDRWCAPRWLLPGVHAKAGVSQYQPDSTLGRNLTKRREKSQYLRYLALSPTMGGLEHSRSKILAKSLRHAVISCAPVDLCSSVYIHRFI